MQRSASLICTGKSICAILFLSFRLRKKIKEVVLKAKCVLSLKNCHFKQKLVIVTYNCLWFNFFVAVFGPVRD